MRSGSGAVCVVALAMAGVLAGCSGDEADSPPQSPESSTPGSPESTTPDSPEPTRPSSEPSAPAEPFDPRDVDLAEAEWTFAMAGWEDAPALVTLSDGAAPTSAQGWDGEVALGEEILYVDMDGDGDEDVIASLAFSAEVNSDTLQWVASSWYVWVNDGTSLTQVNYPLESSGDCSDATPVFTAAADGGVTIEQDLMSVEGAVCAEGATIPTSRTVVLQPDADGVNWLVQTEPVAAWGGDCPFVSGLGYDPVDLVVAPRLDEPAPAEGTAGLAETAPTWLDDAVPGWRIVGFTVNERPDLTWYCGWRQA